MLYSRRHNILWEGMYEILVYTAENNTSKVYNTYVCLRIPPEAIWFVPASVLLARIPPTLCMFFMKLLFNRRRRCLWQPAWSSTTCLLTSPEYTQVQEAHAKVMLVLACMCRTGYSSYSTTEPEEKIMFLDRGDQGGVSSLWLFNCHILNNSFLLFLVLVHSSSSAGRRGAVATGVMNALATWWRRNNERNVNSHWTDPLIQVSILGPCGCSEEISSVILCAFLLILS